MEYRDFCYFLQGWQELNGGKLPSEDQWEVIKEHLQLCFNKVTTATTKTQGLKPENIPTAPVKQLWGPGDQIKNGVQHVTYLLPHGSC